jgi:hypothetical protein
MKHGLTAALAHSTVAVYARHGDRAAGIFDEERLLL